MEPWRQAKAWHLRGLTVAGAFQREGRKIVGMDLQAFSLSPLPDLPAAVVGGKAMQAYEVNAVQDEVRAVELEVLRRRVEALMAQLREAEWAKYRQTQLPGVR